MPGYEAYGKTEDDEGKTREGDGELFPKFDFIQLEGPVDPRLVPKIIDLGNQPLQLRAITTAVVGTD